MKPFGVITGASSGIGKAYAFELAKTHNLLLVGRNEESLNEVMIALKRFKNKVNILVADLAKEEDLKRLETKLSKTRVDILINSAGFGDSHDFRDASADSISNMIYVHVVSTTILSHIVLRGMIEQNHGIIINVASVSGFSKVNAGNLVYNSTKAYLIRFSELLQQTSELKDKIKIQVLCPGFTQTGFFKEQKHATKIPGFLWMKAEDVVKRSLKHLNSGKTVFIPGWHNFIIAKLIGNGFFLPILKFINKYA